MSNIRRHPNPSNRHERPEDLAREDAADTARDYIMYRQWKWWRRHRAQKLRGEMELEEEEDV